MREHTAALHYDAFRSRKTRCWVAQCLESAVCAQGEGPEEVRCNLEEALTLYWI